MYSSRLQFFASNISSFDRLWRSSLLPSMLALALALFGISSTARAVTPAPDGGYPENNTAEGTDALFSLQTGGTNNTAIGFQALYSNTFGDDNTATGLWALFSNTEGVFNTANGAYALYHNTNGNDNTANGLQALFSNTTGTGNTASGVATLALNTTGNYNTAGGENALYDNTTGDANTANGFQALFNNTTGNNNTASGFQALDHNTTAVGNTASGYQALFSNKTGLNNTANGRMALQNNTSGSFNIGLGNLAGHNLTTGSNNIDIGNQGVAGESQVIRIGQQGNQKSAFIAGIFGTAVTGSQVVVNSNGKLGVAASSARFKEAIKPMEKASEAILGLKPVTFRYKEEIDPAAIPQFGLVAEEVEKVSPDLVVRGGDGKVMTVRYEAVNAMLLNEFLKEHRKVEEQGAMIARQQRQIEALAATVQKVSEQIEMSEPARRLVTNP